MPVTQQSRPATPETDKPLWLSEVISALCFAIDLTEGLVPGHSLRTCVLGMRIARRYGLPTDLTGDLYYALLLKDIGCSSNAARVSQIIGGDDRAIKGGIKLEDWTNRYSLSMSGLALFWRTAFPNASPLLRLMRLAALVLNSHRNNLELVALRCERGAQIVRKLGFSDAVAAGIVSLDEHWDGHGYPKRLQRTAIPILARILAVAQHLDIFATARSPEFALKVLRERESRWFDPDIVRITIELNADRTLWKGCRSTDDHDVTMALALELAPPAAHPLPHQEIDRICEAFAEVVDAKSPFTYRHSLGVADVAYSIARTLRLPEPRCQLVRRASLLHDLGKLSVPNTILDKSGVLSSDERRHVQEHPRLTRQILARIGPLQEIAAIAGAHHEKLDGSGYPDHLTASDIPLEARILAVADMYRALTEKRPYRPALTHAQVMKLLRRDTPRKLDPRVVDALESYHRSSSRPGPSRALNQPEPADTRKSA